MVDDRLATLCLLYDFFFLNFWEDEDSLIWCPYILVIAIWTGADHYVLVVPFLQTLVEFLVSVICGPTHAWSLACLLVPIQSWVIVSPAGIIPLVAFEKLVR